MPKELENILIAKEVTPTPMRLMVLEFLLKQTAAVSLANHEKKFQYSDRTILYRTLKTFEEKGLIHHINDGSEASKYALCEAECKVGDHHDLHVHFYCNPCKELFCLPKTQIPQINLPGLYQLQEVSLVVRGICDSCTQLNNNAIELHDKPE